MNKICEFINVFFKINDFFLVLIKLLFNDYFHGSFNMNMKNR